MNHAIDEMADTSEIKPFLKANRAEVLDMLFEEYDEAKDMELFKKDGREEGRKEAREEEKDKTTKIISEALEEGRVDKEVADYLINRIKES